MYPHLEEEIRRQEAEIARQERIMVPLYTTVPRTEEEKRKEADRSGDAEARGDNASSLPFPLNPEVRSRVERAEGPSPVLDLQSWPRGMDVLSCNRYMLEQQLVCDTWFLVGEQKGAGEVSQRIGAHAYVLRSRSSAFYAMLSQEGRREGAEGERQRERERERESEDISLPVTSPKVFWQLLRYLYYEHLKLEDPDSVMELLDLANAYEVVALQEACLRFLGGNLAAGSACAVLEKAHEYRDQALKNATLTFIRQHGNKVIESSAVAQLCRECLNRVLTLDGLNLTPRKRQEVADRWARSHHRHLDNDDPAHTNTTTTDTKTPADQHNLLGDVVYVQKDPDQSRCYFSDSLTEKRRFDKREQERLKRSPKISPFSAGSELRQVTRFRETGGGSVTNSGSPDAVTFSVDRPVYLYGFGVYGKGPGDGQEVSYRVNTALTRKKDDLVLESIVVKGVGAILPVMLHKPVKLKGDKEYTLAVYMQGPASRCGASGKARVRDGEVTFTFSKAPREVKGNRTDVATGQIPRLYYLPC